VSWYVEGAYIFHFGAAVRIFATAATTAFCGMSLDESNQFVKRLIYVGVRLGRRFNEWKGPFGGKILSLLKEMLLYSPNEGPLHVCTLMVTVLSLEGTSDLLPTRIIGKLSSSLILRI